MDYFDSAPASDSGLQNGNRMPDMELQAKFNEAIRQREEQEASKLAENKERAKEALENFEAERQTKLRESMQNNREAEQLLMEQLASDIESENPWDRIVSLVDLQTGMSDETLDVSRMRQVLIQLKNSPPSKADE
mmetsp:Transcript_11368/g.15550  ORF Transcript_11368/g.15550 Transcript_11368/m.15550 type:complete len:135 (+) Transcript_11368:102-506(+)|eukprot:CAMPEP_0197285606 /NCGR_PEP_ID=MMETSP0890-20130614/961_1 /TAXON_ID=44058 ORGANISM="Aureoumbra lagunensis, Strain CCMP1510" /NCGR_SAMPLE_ID=MMETSP0890 /ASSEMBLY_ACC=CAM_ASM_000533 /LENGTH=134 /DNA_ID=CAMNT_0042753291 /DNA_START=69 /DNA_END=473 /DNA_ORIENTATION=+